MTSKNEIRKQATEAYKRFVLENLPRMFLRGDPAHYERDFDFFHMGSVVSLHWESNFGADCSLRLSLDQEPVLSWSSMQRSITNAVASIAVYQQTVNFAAAVELFRQDLLRGINRAQGA